MAEDAREFAVEVARLAEDYRCEDVVVLDLRGISPVADFFVIATGTSDRQMQAVADAAGERAAELGRHLLGRAGYEAAQWILLDHVDVVVHIFDAERRDYYDLELLWVGLDISNAFDGVSKNLGEKSFRPTA